MIENWTIHGFDDTRVISVDGIDLSQTSAGRDVLILPGRHTVSLDYTRPRFVWWHAFVFFPPIVGFPYYGDVEFTAESGVRYEPAGEYQDDLNARGFVKEQFTGLIVGMGILSAPESWW